MKQLARLPAGFDELVPFVESWGYLTRSERYLQCQQLPLEQLMAFQAALSLCATDIFKYLDTFPLDRPLPDSANLLLRLVMSRLDVARAIAARAQPLARRTENYSADRWVVVMHSFHDASALSC